MKRIENCVNVQAQVPTDPTVRNFGMNIKGVMMEVHSSEQTFSKLLLHSLHL